MEEIRVEEMKKLHCIIPASIFVGLREHGMLNDIDTVVARLLLKEIQRREDGERKMEEENGRKREY